MLKSKMWLYLVGAVACAVAAVVFGEEVRRWAALLMVKVHHLSVEHLRGQLARMGPTPPPEVVDEARRRAKHHQDLAEAEYTLSGLPAREIAAKMRELSL